MACFERYLKFLSCHIWCMSTVERYDVQLFCLAKLRLGDSYAVLAFLAIYRQIRDFGPLHGDRNFGLAIDCQSPKFRDFESQTLAKSANFKEPWRFWRITVKISNIYRKFFQILKSSKGLISEILKHIFYPQKIFWI